MTAKLAKMQQQLAELQKQINKAMDDEKQREELVYKGINKKVKLIILYLIKNLFHPQIHYLINNMVKHYLLNNI